MAAAGLNPGAEHRMVLIKIFLYFFLFLRIFYLDKRTI
jgi:hypothetical protein